MLSRIRLSQVLGQPVASPGGRSLGKVTDAVVRLGEDALPTVTGGLVQIEGEDVFVSIKDVAGLEEGGFHLATESVDTRPFERRPGEVLLDRDVRDRAVIDVDRGRLLRVSDLVLVRNGERWDVAAVVASVAGGLGAALGRLLGRPERVEEVDWKDIEPLVGHVPTAQRRIAFPRLAQLKPAEIADLVEQASHEEGEQILEAVSADEEFEADVFEELDEDHRVEFLKGRSDGEAAEVLSKMEPDHAADLLMQLPQERRKPVLDLLEHDQMTKVRKLLGYHPDTAGGLMNNEFVVVPGEETAAAALERLRKLDEVPAILTDLFVEEGGRLSGAIRLRDLIRADPDARLRDLMQEPEMVFADADLPGIAVLMADYNLSSLPVVDEGGRLVGIVTYDDLVEAMLPEEWRWRGRPAEARLSGPAPPQV